MALLPSPSSPPLTFLLQAPAQEPHCFPTPAMERTAQELQAASDAKERTRLLLSYAKRLAPLPESARADANRVMGCTAQVGRRAPPACICWESLLRWRTEQQLRSGARRWPCASWG